MPRRLPHYLRSYRRRNALSQTDLAALLGSTRKGRISWYERGALPPIEVALTLEAIFGTPIAELLGGAYEEAAFNVRRRARELLKDTHEAPTPRRLRRRRTLERIAA